MRFYQKNVFSDGIINCSIIPVDKKLLKSKIVREISNNPFYGWSIRNSFGK
jgi:hypothetical protein